ncbi:hypothetical protein J1G35_10595 [Pseudomonas sp. SH10-3B]|uniref:hypothetical protein n=1 Tax=Pseudomonas sp. SH10-3B TaxID=2816049 RepID=UPI001CA6C0B4|nr:hypothetical protein [Pseudomonas sp. SH10-3B]MBY8946314.1 hypothetical protein [Pseudomonas sp. SH10-3B]
MKNIMDEAIQGLLNLHLTKGVQPSDLSNNLFDQEYVDFNIKKKNGALILDLSYMEETDELPQKISMRYTYNSDRYLVLIEQKIGTKKFNVQWCRLSAVAIAIRNVTDILAGAGISPAVIGSILETLPNDLKESIVVRLRSVA